MQRNFVSLLAVAFAFGTLAGPSVAQFAPVASSVQEPQAVQPAPAVVAAQAPAASQEAAAKTKILVTPFEYGAAANSLYAFSLSVAAHVAERLEDDPVLEPLNGDLVLTDAQARLVTPKGAHYDLAAANRLARAKGAKYFYTGRFSGQTWTWKTEVFLFEADTHEPKLVGRGTATGDMTDLIDFVDWRDRVRQVRTNSADRLFAQVGAATAEAFAQAGVPLAPQTLAAITARPTASRDAFASLLLGRAYARYFNGGASELDPASAVDVGQATTAGGKKLSAKAKAKAKKAAKAKAAKASGTGTAMGWAKVAATNDPGHAEAKRFYAALLEKNGQPRLARFQYEFALEAKPTDVRSLVQLGKIEMSMNNADVAEVYLKRATEARPQDGDPFYWYGLALLQLGKGDGGISALETARTLQPYHGPARKELAGQYAVRQRYLDAAAEFDAIAKDIETNNPDIVYLQAACLRAGDRPAYALDILGAAAQRFPAQARMRKFRGDLLTVAGDVEGARSEYREAFRIDPNDARLTAMFDQTGDKTMPLGGQTLLLAVSSGLSDDRTMEAHRSGWQTAVNVAIADLDDNGAKACVDGRAPSYALLAQRLGEGHRDVGRRFVGAAVGISQSFRDGESAALTPDEAASARKVVAAAKVSERDAREMDAQYHRVLLPLYEKFGCDDYDGPLTEATVPQAKARNADRQVTLPIYKPPASVTTFSPLINPQEARRIRFVVNNAEGAIDRELTLDGQLLGSIPAGEKAATFSTFVGYHTLCLLPAGQACGELTTVRTPFLHEGWTIRVRAATETSEAAIQAEQLR